MARLLRMPEVAANATEAVLQNWSVEESVGFSAEEPVATVETEKAVIDIEAESDGVILKQLVSPGSQVEVGAPIAVLGDPGEQVDDLEALLAELGVAPDAAKTTAPTVARRTVPDDPEGGTANTGEDTLPAPELAQQVTTTNGDGRGGRIFASPLARRLASEAGLSLEEIRGSRPGGRIVHRDVKAALEQRAASAGPPGRTGDSATAAAPQHPPTEVSQGAAAAFTDVPHSRIRKAIAARLTESKQAAPHFYVRATIDARRLLKMRSELNDEGQHKISLTDLVVKAVARAHALVPEMNVTWSPDSVRHYSAVDVALAVATDRGLLTPVVRAVDSQSLTAVAAAAKDLAERARAGHLRQDELEGGSITVTNLGMFATEEFAAIINPPHSAILAVGAVREEPRVRRGKVRVTPVLRVTLSVDHRPVDGVVAARWMQAFVALVEKPARILA